MRTHLRLMLACIGLSLSAAVFAACSDQGPVEPQLAPPAPAAEKRDTTPTFTPLSEPIQTDSTCRNGTLGGGGRC
ncbi:MAG TPA: hypothetical protein VF746_13240 [Longimicrobium sp.]|jgi:hypothetical protein